MDDLRRIDLNLLLTLHALLAEKHVTRAAVRLHKSQPAVSHALAQLRDIFKDPLLTRRGAGMALTPRAQDLLQPLELALNQLNALLNEGAFDPRQAVRCFRVAMSDYAAHLVLPTLVKRLRDQAPGIDVIVCQASREAMLAQLADGEIDLALGVFPDTASDIVVETLFEEHFVSVADKRSLPLRGKLSLDKWMARPHVLVATRPNTENEIDAALAAQGRRRHIALVLPHWRASTEVLVDTDLILTVASRTLDHVRDDQRLTRFLPPFPLPRFAFQQAWHVRRDADSAHHWFRSVVMDCSRAIQHVVEK
ncbi:MULTISPECIES: LysR family transcriptional regulator [Gammaproteobacteria]|jgi:DNA-binding transcriptional LysR family regulator|uniref:LysR family transcriptional regulator n=1 Tax=Gammaproteobacteria TaxID=1236 RepID=UPI000D021540|nr:MULTISPECIES: LysR family transcriptional regulator [Gammaproteobacteria]HCA9872223.1 LysR family transcriptional regulator [Klebsiella pneumoniae]EJA3269562.1 LysR family transcriptional regulator [Pseudomonas aeruginosa]EKU0579518.1 LysR family transcriptional regulator [Pseudomonas aeruginosa]ELM5224890.1 LysR family transcriptional regulator [Pseudomonas aeruginosa]ELP1421601.1 LysR family transcriptional regulator [Pseudomonas aeruginosa]